ncbi:MAG: calcium/sodium antiporter [Proteobacteria bacterium]|nr:calcium/sodium antiporter [Pseudomonadota bacterium]
MASNILGLVIGLILLTLGSDWLVKGASLTAMSLSIRPIIIGLTIVAFATSAPELLVSFVAALKGSSGISVGNIIGSNIINIALVLGLSSVFRPLHVNQQVASRELPYMIMISILFWIFCLDGTIGRLDGIILLIGLIIFLIYGFYTAKETDIPSKIVKKPSVKTYFYYAILIISGFCCLAFGADLVVKNAIVIARQFNISDVFIGLSIVAVGTSLPELATSVVAVLKGESDISLGNVVGSNIFNICMVMGVIGMLSPIENIDPGLYRFEFPAMIFLSVFMFVITRFDLVITRLHGIFLLTSFIFYICISYYLIK